MERKKAVYRGLKDTPVYIEDKSLNSPDYFQIAEFPERLTAGKNLIKLRGNPQNLEPSSYINIEVLDYNGDPIYNEIIDYIDEDKARVIAIYIYEETSPGDALVTITGTANNVPDEWQRKTNVKWSRSVAVNPTAVNISEIIFEEEPTVSVTEQIAVQLDRTYTLGQFPTYNSGSIRLLTLNQQPAIIMTGGKFNADMQGGTVTVTSPTNPTPTPLYTPSNNVYSTTIKKVLSETTAILDSQYIVYSSQSLGAHIYTQFENSAYDISYEASPNYVVTENSESVAILEINGLEPATGDVSRIKVYTSGKGTVGTWELANNIELEETEIFVQGTSSLFPDQSVGSFVTQSVIDSYWEAHTYIGKTETTGPTLTWTTESLSNAMDIIQVIDTTAENAVNVVQVTGSFAGNFVKDSAYKVTFDALATRSTTSSNRNPIIYVYASGSAFNYDTTDYYNQELAVNVGKRIGRLEITSDSKRIDDYTFNFKADRTGTGVLLFVIDAGEWLLSDIRTTTDNDPGYTPNYTRIRTEIPTKHKSANQLAFKVEYYNQDGVRSKLINYIYNKSWEGGNRYIDGDFSMLTGSLYVADSLSSGVAISGYKNTGYIRSLGYDGFAANNPGFLMWSGSALSGSAGTKGGVPYSGVGLELYADADNYFRYSTDPSELDIRTQQFFVGNSSTFLSASNGNLEISSSGLNIFNGVITGSNLLIESNGSSLLDTSNGTLDGFNIVKYLPITDINQDIGLYIPNTVEKIISYIVLDTPDTGTGSFGYEATIYENPANGFGNVIAPAYATSSFIKSSTNRYTALSYIAYLDGGSFKSNGTDVSLIDKYLKIKLILSGGFTYDSSSICVFIAKDLGSSNIYSGTSQIWTSPGSPTGSDEGISITL